MRKTYLPMTKDSKKHFSCEFKGLEGSLDDIIDYLRIMRQNMTTQGWTDIKLEFNEGYNGHCISGKLNEPKTAGTN